MLQLVLLGLVCLDESLTRFCGIGAQTLPAR